MKNGLSTPGSPLATGLITQPFAARRAARVAAYVGAGVVTAWSAILAKEAGVPPPLASVSPAIKYELPAMIELVKTPTAPVVAEVEEAPNPIVGESIVLAARSMGAPSGDTESRFGESAELDAATLKWARDPRVRWFNGRPARPARTITMVVTAYSPDERSCGDSADGLTSTLHSVTTNAHKLVAADPRVLPMGSMLSIPGYDACKVSGESRIVPVLDIGGKIKGNRLDVLFPTHAEARRWGVRKLPVTVWEYCDGRPAENPRKVR